MLTPTFFTPALSAAALASPCSCNLLVSLNKLAEQEQTLTSGPSAPVSTSTSFSAAPAPLLETPRLLNTASFAAHRPAKLARGFGALAQYARSASVKLRSTNVALSELTSATNSTSTPTRLAGASPPEALPRVST